MIENIARHWAMNDDRSRVQAADRGGGRGRQSDHRRDADGGRRPAADAVRLRADGPLYGADPGQRLGGDGVLLLRRRDHRAVADDALRAHGTAWKRTSHEDTHGGKLGDALSHASPRGSSRPSAARRLFLIAVGVATIVACSMFYFKTVTVKLLPFDNKSELQVVVDMPEGTSLEATARVLEQAAAVARQVPEVEAMEAYAGTAAPFNFNGLVRHYFLRDKPWMGDLVVTLAPKGDRSRDEPRDRASTCARGWRAIQLPPDGVDQGRRDAARAAGAGDPACRDLWARRGRTPRDRADRSKRSSSRCPISSMSTTASA